MVETISLNNLFSHYKGREGTLLFFLFAFLFLTAAFGFNIFSLAVPDWFDTFQVDSERLVVGRLYASATDGFLAHGFILTRFEEGRWIPYESAVGLQGMVFDVLRITFNLSVEQTVDLAHILSSAFTALVLMSLVIWVERLFGLTSAALMVFGIFTAPWLLVFGRNLYWVLGTFFLPLAWLAWRGQALEEASAKETCFVLAVYFLMFFVKCACGYEYLSTIVIASWAPLCYFALAERWPWQRLLKIVFWTGGLSVLAFLLAALVNALLLPYAEGGTFADAVITIVKRWDARMGMPVATDAYIEYPESLTISRFGVISTYLHGVIVGPFITNSFWFWPPTHGMMALFALATAALSSASALVFTRMRPYRTQIWGLSVMLVLSLFATLSWHIIAKQHSAIHTHMNFVLWHLPFTLIFWALIGYLLGLLLSRLR